MTINKRIELIMNQFKMNKNSFSVKIGCNPTIIHNLIKGRNAPSYELICKILSSFDTIDANWLLTGGGEMCINVQKNQNFDVDKYENSTNNELLIKIIAQKDKRIEELSVQIGKLLQSLQMTI